MKSDARNCTGEVSQNDAKAPNRCKKKASGGGGGGGGGSPDAKQMLFLFSTFTSLCKNEEPSFDLCSAGASSPGR